MHLLLRTTLLLRLGDVMRVDACERHSEYSRVVHGLVPPRSLALSFGARSAPGCDASISPIRVAGFIGDIAIERRRHEVDQFGHRSLHIVSVEEAGLIYHESRHCGIM